MRTASTHAGGRGREEKEVLWQGGRREPLDWLVQRSEVREEMQVMREELRVGGKVVVVARCFVGVTPTGLWVMA